jgi:hypothetical protein
MRILLLINMGRYPSTRLDSKQAEFNTSLLCAVSDLPRIYV